MVSPTCSVHQPACAMRRTVCRLRAVTAAVTYVTQPISWKPRKSSGVLGYAYGQAPFADQRNLKMAQNHVTIRRKRDHLEMGITHKQTILLSSIIKFRRIIIRFLVLWFPPSLHFYTPTFMRVTFSWKVWQQQLLDPQGSILSESPLIFRGNDHYWTKIDTIWIVLRVESQLRLHIALNLYIIGSLFAHTA